MTSNADLVRLTGLPNLDTITDVMRLINLAAIADRKSELRSNAGPRAKAFILYADRATDKADKV